MLFHNRRKQWPGLTSWPPDIFAVTGYIPYVTGVYRKAMCNQWWSAIDPKHPARLEASGRNWRRTTANLRKAPAEVLKEWQLILQHRNVLLREIEGKRRLVNALLNLVAMADVACEGFGLPHPNYTRGEAEFRLLERADRLLSRGARQGVSSTLGMRTNSDMVCILPKIHTPQVGLTFRSLTHHLALCPTDEVRPIWNGIDTAQARRDHTRFNLLLVPIPEEVSPKQFAEVNHARSGRHRMPKAYRSFTFIPAQRSRWLRGAFKKMARAAVAATADKFIHGVVFPEMSLASPEEFEIAYDSLQEICPGAFLISGVAEPNAEGSNQGRNCAYYAIPQIEPNKQTGVEGSDVLCTQAKHHKWKITPEQVSDYGLNAVLDPTKNWWENIEIEERHLNFFALKQWLIFTFVICEDLARQEPASRLVRAVGPTLVIALLMDNEQVKVRWPARYATVLAEDPGCSVLTLTCRGMAALGAERFHKSKKKTCMRWHSGAISTGPTKSR